MTDFRANPIQSITSNVRRIAITPERARISGGIPTSPTGSNKSIYASKPDQVVMTAARTSAKDGQLRFIFPFSPQAVSYGEMAPEVAELKRPGKKPLVAFSRFKARRVDLEFLLAVPFDGLHIDIEESIKLLELIASTGRPVWFYNADSFLALNNYQSGRYNPRFFWSIVELSFQSVRRNRAQKITQARVSMSLVENTNPKVTVIELPKIKYTENVPRSNTASSSKKTPRINDFMTTAGIIQLQRSGF